MNKRESGRTGINEKTITSVPDTVVGGRVAWKAEIKAKCMQPLMN